MKPRLFSEEQKASFLQRLSECQDIPKALKAVKANQSMLTLTKADDKEFAAAIEEIKGDWSDTVERALIEKACGLSQEVKEVYVTLKDQQGNPILDESGRPKTVLHKREIRSIAPDSNALALWLRAWRPDNYQKNERLDLIVAEREKPEEMRNAILERLKEINDRHNKTK